jgi:hypothetical protein
MGGGVCVCIGACERVWVNNGVCECPCVCECAFWCFVCAVVLVCVVVFVALLFV